MSRRPSLYCDVLLMLLHQFVNSNLLLLGGVACSCIKHSLAPPLNQQHNAESPLTRYLFGPFRKCVLMSQRGGGGGVKPPCFYHLTNTFKNQWNLSFYVKKWGQSLGIWLAALTCCTFISSRLSPARRFVFFICCCCCCCESALTPLSY